MKGRHPWWPRLWLAIALAATAMILGGCATTDDAENASERPWNAPKSWENGVPIEMMEGR